MAPPRVDKAREQLEEQIVGALRDQPGFLRFQLLVDRRTGRSIGMSWWETEEAMLASDRVTEDSRRRAFEIGGAVGKPDVQAYEVVVDTEV
jgi:heme-degrading monooxygenase HmoA